MGKDAKSYFYKGNQNLVDGDEDNLDLIKQEILQIFDVKNLSFLIGAGCSSYKLEGTEIGVPVMQDLADEFYNKTLGAPDKTFISKTLKIDISKDPFKENLEKLLEILHSYRFLLESQNGDLKKVNNLILKVRNFLLDKCTNEANNEKYNEVIDLYKLFYKKLIYRDNNLTKTNIFTTNYDLYTENALDSLGILYTNGFSGLAQRNFNPAVFNYAYAEQMELSNNKWNVIDNFIYLYKLHGSINWIEADTDNHLFKVRELQSVDKEADNVMIYPTPTKQIASFASPYSDLFREFQKKLMQDTNILVVIGYSFSDEHINNLIYQALTIPTFRLVIFQDAEKENMQQLVKLDDPRIWIIGGIDGTRKIHHFDYVTKDLLPSIDQEKIEDSVDKVIQNLLKKK